MHNEPAASTSPATEVSAGWLQPAVDYLAPINRRVILRAAELGMAGTLGMVSWIGFAAALGMAADELKPEQMIERLQTGWDVRLFVVAALLLMSLVTGYIAARRAAILPLRHALVAGAALAGLKAALGLLLGYSLPGWLEAITLVATLPMAAFGGYLAQPRLVMAAASSAKS